MAERSASTERRLPSLLERITDRKRDEAGGRRVPWLQRYRDSVLADIEALLNTSCRSSTMEWDQFPEIRRSVLNFGITPISGLTEKQLAEGELERSIATSIQRFEPRIAAGSLIVRKIDSTHNAVSFEIRGQLWGPQVSEEIYIRTQVDLESGRCDIQDRSRG